MKKGLLLLTILLMNFISYSGVLSEYRKVKRDVNTTKEILGIDGTQTEHHTSPGATIFWSFVLILALFGLFLIIRKIRKEKKQRIIDIDNCINDWRSKFQQNNLTFPEIANPHTCLRKELACGYGSPNSTAEVNGFRGNDFDKHFQHHFDILINAKLLEERYANLIKKYGQEKADKLFREKFEIGWTKDDILESKQRRPDHIETEVLKTKTKETWVYGNKSSGDVFVFVNDILERFKDR